jgi:hypothetical protein
MKTSKIIFLSILAMFALIILASAIFIKIQGQKINTSSITNDNHTFTKKEVPSFKVLSINNSTNIRLVRNDSTFLEIYFSKDSLAPVVNYITDKDTLKIKDFTPHSGNKFILVRVNYVEPLNHIELKNSSVFIESLSSKKMLIEMDSSTVMANDQSGKSDVRVLSVFGKNQSVFQIRTGKFKFDSLNIILRNSKAYLYSNENKLSCDISNKSNVRLTEQPLEIVMKKDSTSQFSVRETQTVFR